VKIIGGLFYEQIKVYFLEKTLNTSKNVE